MIRRSRFFIPALLVLLLPMAAQAQFSLSGDISAERVDGALGDWAYTLHVAWNTGTRYGLSHLDLIFDDGSNCACNEICRAILWPNPVGYMTVEGGALLEVVYELNCNGDPSIDLTSPVFKFTPLETEECEAGPVGEMTVMFYSDYAPAPIAQPNLFLVDKYAQYSDFGFVTGVFPGLLCDPVPVQSSNWGSLKALYR